MNKVTQRFRAIVGLHKLNGSSSLVTPIERNPDLLGLLSRSLDCVLSNVADQSRSKNILQVHVSQGHVTQKYRDLWQCCPPHSPNLFARPIGHATVRLCVQQRPSRFPATVACHHLRKGTKLELGRGEPGKHRAYPHTTKLPQRVNRHTGSRRQPSSAISLEGESGPTSAGRTRSHSYPETWFKRERARDIL